MISDIRLTIGQTMPYLEGGINLLRAEIRLYYRGGNPKMENFVFIITPFKLKILDQNIKYHLMSLALPFV